MLQVWFKNRRAKWRKTKREEEAARRSEDLKRKPSHATSGLPSSAAPESERVHVDVCEDRDIASDNEATASVSEISYSSKDNRNDSYCESDVSSPSSPSNLDCNPASGDEQDLSHDRSREGSSSWKPITDVRFGFRLSPLVWKLSAGQFKSRCAKKHSSVVDLSRDRQVRTKVPVTGSTLVYPLAVRLRVGRSSSKYRAG